MKLVRNLTTLGLIAIVTSVVQAQNIALNKPVTLFGTFGTLRPGAIFGPAPLANANSLVDGTYLAEGTPWQNGTVWWDAQAPGATTNSIEIDLLGVYEINFVGIQGDNNDEYRIEYLNASNVWVPGARALTMSGAGMRTRTGNIGPWIAKKVRLTGLVGDQYYSLSEFQAHGTLVPEPSSMLAMVAGLALICRRRTAS